MYTNFELTLQGCKIKMDDSGNILIKRIAKSNVYVKTASPDDNAVSSDILKLPNSALEPEKPVKLFDMKKFQQVWPLTQFISVCFL